MSQEGGVKLSGSFSFPLIGFCESRLCKHFTLETVSRPGQPLDPDWREKCVLTVETIMLDNFTPLCQAERWQGIISYISSVSPSTQEISDHLTKFYDNVKPSSIIQ